MNDSPIPLTPATGASPAPGQAPQRVVFIGLGTMGAPMAGHLLRAGHDVCVVNRRAQRAQDWVAAHGGRWAPTPAQAVVDADVVLSCVGRDEDVQEVMLGSQGGLAHMRAGAVWVDHTTTSAALARQAHEWTQARGVAFVDAPVSGGNVGAQQGQLTIMCGGSQAAFDSVRPVIGAYARAIRHLGGPGSGQLAKMVNQICVAGVLQSLAEALAFGERAGLDMPAVLELITQGAAGSWQMSQRGPTMLKREFEFGFAVDWMRKDLGLVLQEARTQGASLPVTALIDQFYADVQAMGGGRQDTSSLIRRLD